MRFKKYLSIALSVLFILVCASCEKAGDMPERGPFGPEDYKTIEPPADGWTLDDLNEVLYINGYEVDFPFTLEDIHWDKELYDVEYYEDQGMLYAGLLDIETGTNLVIGSKTNEKKDFSKDLPIDVIQFTVFSDEEDKNPTPGFDDFIVINGLGLSGDASDLVKYYGDHDEFEDPNDRFNSFKFTVGDDKCQVSITYHSYNERKLVDNVTIILL
jgi:hypothetical protein